MDGWMAGWMDGGIIKGKGGGCSHPPTSLCGRLNEQDEKSSPANTKMQGARWNDVKEETKAPNPIRVSSAWW